MTSNQEQSYMETSLLENLGQEHQQQQEIERNMLAKSKTKEESSKKITIKIGNNKKKKILVSGSLTNLDVIPDLEIGKGFIFFFHSRTKSLFALLIFIGKQQ